MFAARWFRADEVRTDDRAWAYNLALFRVVFLLCVAMPFSLYTLRWTTDTMPGLPPTAWAPISFYRWLPFQLISDAALAQNLARINVVLIFLGLLGVFTRWSLGLATLVSIYVFGLMQNQGKVDHFHHIVWFMAVLAGGPSGLFLSVDSVIRAVRGADRGVIEPPVPRAAALWALRYMWLLIGLLYVIPGLAKLEAAAMRGWVTASNLQHILWRKWFESSLYSPGFELPWRVDIVPSPLLTTGGVVVIVFELTFVILVLLRPLRPLLALGGIAFHVGNGLFLGIWFESLMLSYVCLIDWTGLARSIWKRIDGTRMLILYDGDCRLCRRTIALLRSIDMLDALEPVAARADDARRHRHPQITDDMLVRDMYAIHGDAVSHGYDAYVRLATRVPLLWPLLPILVLPPVPAIGRLVYRRVAESRTCSLIPRDSVRPPAAPPSATVLHWVGAIVVLLEASVGGWMFAATLSRHHLAPGNVVRTVLVGVAWRAPVWPFDQYPTFAYIPASVLTVWDARVAVSDGRELPFDARVYAATFGAGARSWNVAQALVWEFDPARHRSRSLDVVKALWSRTSREKYRDPVAIRVYHVDYRLGVTGPIPVAETLMHVFTVPPRTDR